MTTHSATKNPAWQDLRAEILQRACTEIAERLQNGSKLMCEIGSVAKQLDKTDLGPGRRLSLSPKTLERYWYAWLANARKPSAFALNYAPNGQRPKIDPLLLRLLIEQTLVTGAPLSEIVGRLKSVGARISLPEVRRAFPKGDLRKFERSHKQLTRYRVKLEKDFIAAGAKWRRALLKRRTEALRKILAQDAALERRILRNRDQLQRKFFQADARAVRQRERVQRALISRIEVTK